ncbi:MAG: transglycosylase domain-containing protein [Betaproteobacteria bacterium]|nr:transglycosylase domain-containing protein [Betaproteobacteria bacterium]
MPQYFRFGLGSIALCLAMAANAQLPSFAQVRAAYRPSDAVLLDRNGIPLSDVRIDPHTRRLDWTPLDKFSPALRAALIASEDKRFFEHEGVDWKAVAGSVWHNLFHHTHRGGSTLTMQLAGLLDPNLALPHTPGGRRNLGQKWDQGLAARELETHWTKPQILEAYLNLAPFRGDLQGVNAASSVLFGKTPAEIGQAEALLITAILPSPNAKAERIALRACARAKVMNDGPSTCKKIQQLASKLDTPRNRPRYMLAPQLARRMLHQGGEQVTTTLDAPTQRNMLESLRGTLATQASSLGTSGLLLVDNTDGSVRAWVGNAGSGDSDALLLRTSWRDAALPFAATLAIEKRLANAATLLPISANEPNAWRSLRTSVQNTDAASSAALLALTGDGLSEKLQSLGLDAHAEALPAVEASLPQLAQAIRSLATGDFCTTRLQAEPGVLLRRSWHADAAFIGADILSDARARSALFAEALPADAGWHMLWTLNAQDDAGAALIAVGERQTIAVIVAADKTRTSDDTRHLAARILRDALSRLDASSSRTPRAPSNLTRTLVSFEPPVEPPRREWFLRGTELVLSRATPIDYGATPAILHPLANTGVIELRAGESLILEANPLARGAHWRINDQDLGEGLRLSWRPDPGHYKIELRGPAGELWDSREFTLRQKQGGNS